jgi:hypothetical protein
MSKNKPETQAAYYLKNKVKLQQNQLEKRAERTEKHRERSKKSPRYAFSSTLALARKRAEVTINQDYLMALYDQQEGLCALSGIRMTWATGKTAPTSISIDRIDGKKGYVDGNVRLVCVAVNAFRGIMNDQELLKMAKALVSTMESKQVAKQVLEEIAA